MVDVCKLKGIIVQNDMTQQDIAKLLKMAPKTFYSKMKKGVFGSDEIEQMIDILNIEDPLSVFFVQKE